jgi:hypothetical protein
LENFFALPVASPLQRSERDTRAGSQCGDGCYRARHRGESGGQSEDALRGGRGSDADPADGECLAGHTSQGTQAGCQLADRSGEAADRVPVGVHPHPDRGRVVGPDRLVEPIQVRYDLNFDLQARERLLNGYLEQAPVDFRLKLDLGRVQIIQRSDRAGQRT